MSAGAKPPAIVTWQHLYCALMAVVYVLCIGVGVFMIVFRDEAALHAVLALPLLLIGKQQASSVPLKGG